MRDHDPARETIDDDEGDLLWDAVRFLSEEGLLAKGPEKEADGLVEANHNAIAIG